MPELTQQGQVFTPSLGPACSKELPAPWAPSSPAGGGAWGPTGPGAAWGSLPSHLDGGLLPGGGPWVRALLTAERGSRQHCPAPGGAVGEGRRPSGRRPRCLGSNPSQPSRRLCGPGHWQARPAPAPVHTVGVIIRGLSGDDMAGLSRSEPRRQPGSARENPRGAPPAPLPLLVCTVTVATGCCKIDTPPPRTYISISKGSPKQCLTH